MNASQETDQVSHCVAHHFTFPARTFVFFDLLSVSLGFVFVCAVVVCNNQSNPSRLAKWRASHYASYDY